MFVPAHPDDMITCLGVCHLAKDKFELHVVDFTHGERGRGRRQSAMYSGFDFLDMVHISQFYNGAHYFIMTNRGLSEDVLRVGWS